MADNLDLGSVYFKIDADTGKVTAASKSMDDMAQSADEASNKTKGLGGEANKTNTTVGKLGKEVERTDKNIGSFAKSATAAAVALAGMVASSAGLSKLVDTGRSMGVINASLITATGSAQGAKTAFDDLVVLATRLPNSLDDTIGAFIKLKNLGLDPSEKAIISYTNTASAMGKSLDQMIEAVADASTAEFERLKEFGIRASKQGDEVEFTFRGVTTTVKNSSEEIQGYLLRLGEVDFAGAADERMKTLDGAISNLSDTWDGLFRTIFDSDVGGLIEGGVRTATDAVAALDEMIKNNGDTIKATSIVIGTATGAYAAYRLALVAATIRQWRFNAAVIANPIGLAVTAMGLAAGAMLTYADRVREAKYGVDDLTDSVENLTEKQLENARLEVSTQLIEKERKLAELKERQAEAVERANGQTTGSSFGLGGTGFSAEIGALDVEINKTTESMMLLNGQLFTLDEQLSKPLVIEINSGAGQDGLVSGLDKALQTDSIGYEYQLYADARREGAAEYNKQLQELLETYQTTITPLEQLQRDQAKLNELMKTAGSDDVPKLTAALAEVDKQIEALATDSIDWEGLGADIAGTVTDAMISGDWEGVGTSIGSSLGGAIGGALGSPIAASIGSVVGAALLTFDEIQTTFEENQRKQGTGSVLGSADEQSMSIVDSLDDNSDILKDLIGTNKNLVSALSVLKGSIGGASTLISRDVPTGFGELGNFSIDPISDLFGSIGLGGNYDFLDKTSFGLLGSLGGLLGGSSKVTDEGVRILGGTLEDILNNTTAQAFAEIKTKKYAWSSSKKKTQIQNVSASVENQFDLIFEDIFSAVQSGAEMLGMSDVDISDSLEDFVVRSFNISLKNMNAGQRSAALEAVFSRVFDDLAGAVIPFLREFQEAGESTGETMSRLATQLEVTKYALDILGQNIDTLGSYEAVQLSEYLIQAAGSMETLSQNLTAFVDNFYSDYEQLELLSRQLNKAFDTLNISLPASAEGFKELVQGIDATTEAGAEQLASLLELQGAASDYYDLLDDQTDAVRKYSESISDFTKSLLGDSEKVTAGAYRAELASALEGDRDALDSITQTAQTYLDSQLKTASSAEQYAAIERSVLADMNALQDKLNTVLVEDEDETGRILFDQLAALLNISDGIDAMTGGGYASGGYTGDGAINEIAGVVHKGEYVLSQDMLKNMPVMASAPTSMGTNEASVSIMRAMYGQMQSLNNQVAALKEDNYRMGVGMLNNTRDSADVLEYWRQTNVPVSIAP